MIEMKNVDIDSINKYEQYTEREWGKKSLEISWRRLLSRGKFL